MSKTDWALKDLRISKTAIVKSALEGGQLTRMKGESDELFVSRMSYLIHKVTDADNEHLPKE